MKWIVPIGHYRPPGSNERVPFRQPNAHQSEDGRWVISRSPQADMMRPGDTVTYVLAERPLARAWADVTPDGTRIVAVERGVPDTHEAKLAAINRLKALTGDTEA